MSDDFKDVILGKIKETDKAARIDRALKSILIKVKNDAGFRQSLLQNAGISKKKFHDVLEKHAGFKVPEKFYRNPDYYELVRQIRFSVEGVKYSLDEVESVYSDLIAEIIAQPHKTTAELSNRNRDLYKRVIETGHSKLIWFLSGFGDKQHCFYLPDEELVKQCGEFSSFTELKYNGKGDLHLHIKARELEQRVVFEYPSYLSHYYVGINNKKYRSLAELAIGNMCEFNNEEYEFEASYKINRHGSDKSMICDFLFYDSQQQPVYLEIVQNTEATRGDRRENYANRHKKKLDTLHKHEIVPVCVTADDFYNHGLFNAEMFAHDVSRRLSKRGVYLNNVPAENVLSRQYTKHAEFLMSLDKESLFDYLINEEGISGIAVFDNQYSTLKNILKARADDCIEEFRVKLKTLSFQRRSEKHSERHKKNREQAMPLDKLKRIVRRNQIESQRQWFDFARENKEFLRENNIPCDVASVYKQRGEWISWPDFYGKGARTQ